MSRVWGSHDGPMMVDAVIAGYRVLRETVRAGTDGLGAGGGAIPLRPSAITPDWLTSVLRRHAPGVRVGSVRRLSEVSRTTTHVRIALAYDGAGEEAGLPRTMFVKLAPRDIGTRVFVSLFNLARSETRFYNEIAPEIDAVVPRVYFAAARDRGSGFVVLMEDLDAAGWYTKDVTTPCTIDEARAVVTALARVHGQFWESPRLRGDLAWLPAHENDANVRLLRVLRPLALRRSLARYGEIIPPALRASGALINDAFEALERHWSRPPLTLLHGDPHVGNLYFDGNRVGFLDWQVLRRGQAMRDVTYFMIQSMPTELRRTHEDELLRRYLDALPVAGGSRPSIEAARAQYRLHALYAWIAVIVTAAAARLQAEPIVRTALARVGTALVDLESVGALRSLVR